MRILYVGDPHLEKMSTLFGEKHLTMQLDVIHRLVEVSRAHKVDHVAVLGDVFDNAFPQQESQRAFLRLLARYDDLNWLVYTGNHDREDVNTCSIDLLYELPEIGALKHVTFCKKPRLIKFGDARVQVQAWGGKVDFVPDEADFTFFHHAMVGAKTDTGKEYTKGLSRKKFCGKPAVGGDLHTPQKYGNVLYPGTPVALTFGEKETKQLWIGEFTKKRGLVNKRLEWEPPWHLKTVTFDPDEPPKCSAKNTFYKLRVKRGKSPDARWLLDHPQVVRTEGVKLKGEAAKEAQRVTGVDASQDERDVLKTWLSKNTNLDEKQVKRALRLDERLLHKEVADETT